MNYHAGSSPSNGWVMSQGQADGQHRARAWEGNLITGTANRLAISTLVERASRYVVLLAPLLAEDGIDVDNIDVPALDTLQQALHRAVERHNMTRFIPDQHPN